ncbi:MAG: hypothetical protein HDR43_01860 [Mycoplasma sp.]|nr:hypothetical protein [Mycoplasma sp.]
MKNTIIKTGIHQGVGTKIVNDTVITNNNQWIVVGISFFFTLIYLVVIFIKSTIMTGITATYIIFR